MMNPIDLFSIPEHAAVSDPSIAARTSPVAQSYMSNIVSTAKSPEPRISIAGLAEQDLRCAQSKKFLNTKKFSSKILDFKDSLQRLKPQLELWVKGKLETDANEHFRVSDLAVRQKFLKNLNAIVNPSLMDKLTGSPVTKRTAAAQTIAMKAAQITPIGLVKELSIHLSPPAAGASLDSSPLPQPFSLEAATYRAAKSSRSSADQFLTLALVAAKGNIAKAEEVAAGICRKAIEIGDLDVLDSTVNAGFNLQALTTNGETLMQVALDKGREGAVRKLLDLGVDVNSRDSSGSTPLHHAAAKSHISMVSLLVSAGADISVRNQENKTSYDIASAKGRIENILNLLRPAP